ncbi:esterase/lipase family protein [Spirosoma jeollabukense]
MSSSSTIPISTLLAKYNTLKSDAVSNNLLSVSNDQLYDVPGRPQSPYEERNLFAVAPAKSFSSSNQLSFVFNSSLVWGNGPSINAIEIDFGEGAGYQSASWGTPISHTFSSTGGKRVKVRVTPSVGSTVESHFDLQVLDIDVCVGCRYSQLFDATQTFFPSGSHSGGVAFIHYSQNNTSSPRRIVKPLIVAEGYDPHTVAPLLADNYTFRDFIAAINNLGGASPNSYDFNAALDNAGYDLVFLDYNNGTDDIPRNAALLQEVIQWVNGQKQSGDSQNVVMGQSMGGLIGRYALAQMVRNNIDTQTRLLITHDSPHRGANVPLGVQMAARLAGSINFSYNIFGNSVSNASVRDMIPELDQSLRLFDAPATNQLLIIRATNGTGSTATNTFLDNDYRNMVNLSSTPYRIVATSNGSQCGTALFAPSTTLSNKTKLV